LQRGKRWQNFSLFEPRPIRKGGRKGTCSARCWVKHVCRGRETIRQLAIGKGSGKENQEEKKGSMRLRKDGPKHDPRGGEEKRESILFVFKKGELKGLRIHSVSYRQGKRKGGRGKGHLNPLVRKKKGGDSSQPVRMEKQKKKKRTGIL